MLKNQLLDQVKCFLVLCVLTDLHDSTPSVRGELLFAVVALHVKFGEFCYEGLLHFGVVIDFFFNGDFDFDSFGVAFGPNEAGVDDFGFVESFDFL